DLERDPLGTALDECLVYLKGLGITARRSAFRQVVTVVEEAADRFVDEAELDEGGGMDALKGGIPTGDLGWMVGQQMDGIGAFDVTGDGGAAAEVLCRLESADQGRAAQVGELPVELRFQLCFFPLPDIGRRWLDAGQALQAMPEHGFKVRPGLGE